MNAEDRRPKMSMEGEVRRQTPEEYEEMIARRKEQFAEVPCLSRRPKP
jgi:hypothetical protein